MEGHKILASDVTQEKVQMVEGSGWLGARKLHPDLCSSLTQTSVHSRMLQGKGPLNFPGPRTAYACSR